MKDMENQQVARDITDVLSVCPFIETFDRKTIWITGATGMIGTMLVKVLQTYNRLHNKHIHIVAHARNMAKVDSKLANYIDPNLEIIIGNITSPIIYSNPIDYIIHCASTTASRDFTEQPVETIQTIINGTNNILQLAKEKSINKVVFLSSLEVYGTPEHYEVDEGSNGQIKWTNIRSSYSEGKRVAECLCRSYYEEYSIPVVIARLAQTFGAGIEESDNRVCAQFARAAAQGRDIILRTKGETVRDYCYLSDAIAALLLLLHSGIAGEVYNVANEETACSIAEMADMAVALSNGHSRVSLDLSQNAEQLGYNPIVKIKLLSGKLHALGWKPQNNLTMALKKTINGLI